MKRTTIFGDEAVLESLRELAHRQKTSLSAVIRTALQEYAGKHQGTAHVPSFLGIGRSGRKDIAERAEELLWSGPHGPRKR
jgi:Ribbon-helix-helix protein, copG family